MLSELFEMLPEVGNPDKPKMVFFFDEAHLLFNDAPKSLLEKIEQVVKLIRSKGVGVYFCTQNPRDIPDGVLAQLSNRIQHALRAYTPADQKSVRAAADSFRENPAFNTFDTIMALGTGEAVISLLQEDGTPGIAQKARVLPPQSRMGAVSDYEREAGIRQTPLYAKYAEAVDPESAFEILERLGLEKQAEAERLRQEAELAGARWAFYGHTHRAMEDSSGKVKIFCPGSISAPRDGSRGTYAVVNTDGGQFSCQIFECDRRENGPRGGGIVKRNKPKGGFLRRTFNDSDGQ